MKRSILRYQLGVWLFVAGILPIQAQTIRMSGIYAYQRSGSVVSLSVERIDSYRLLGTVSSTLALQLWATDFPYSGGLFLEGHRLCHTAIGTLRGGYYFEDVYEITTFTEPPPGNYNIVFVLAEWSGFGFEYEVVDWANFATRQTFGIVPPEITAQPQSQTVIVGDTVTFSVSALGSQPMSYQWQRNSMNIVGATGSSYTISNVQVGHAGNYTVVVNNAGGTATSQAAVLTVNMPPAITAQPQDCSAWAGMWFSFSVSASGTAPLNYQWYHDNSPIPGANAATYSIGWAQPSHAGSYKVRVSNVAGTVESAVATLIVEYWPVITGQPQSQTVNIGANATFTVVAVGGPTPTYQWKFKGANISGATASTYTRTNVQLAHAGSYTVVLRNTRGSVTSEAAVLTVNVPPSITVQPQGRVVTAGDSVTLSVSAAGTAPLSYQWLRNNSPLSGATNTSYALTAAQPSDAGDYKVRVTNAGGAVDSAVAVLTVQFGPVIAAQPQSQLVFTGNAAIFRVTANGVPSPACQWRRNGVDIPGATASNYSIPVVATNHAGDYTVVLTNTSGSVTSATAVLTVGILPSLTSQPLSREVVAGSSVTFSVGASGTAPLSFQWFFNGSPIAGATAAAYSISATQPTNAGSYRVRVSNAGGSVESSVATLTVGYGPVIAVHPQSQVVMAGGNTTLSVVASAVPAPTYRWYFNGSSLANATNSTLMLLNVTTEAAGGYYVRVDNAYGTATSAVATLAVLVPFPGIYNTGLSDGRALLADGQVDPHYKLVVNANDPASSSSVVQDSTLFPIVGGPWIQNSSESKWIGPAVDTVGAAAGDYSYQLTLDLTGYDPRTAFLAGSWAVDNNGSIFLNGLDTGFKSESFSAFSMFTLTDGFVSGTNLIEFRVSNGSSWTGLRVENLRGTVQTETPAPCATPPSGLVSWWQAEGNASDTVGGNSGVLLHGATFAAGKVGQAFSLDGTNNYIRVADQPNLHTTNALTIEAWLYPTRLGVDQALFQRWGVIPHSYQKSYTSAVAPDGRVYLIVCANGDDSTAVGISSTNSLPLNQWMHFAATYDGSFLKVYLNGMCESQTAYNQGIFAGTNDLTIGARGELDTGQVSYPFAGRIDEPAVYSRALSAAEIQAIYNAGSSGKCALPQVLVEITPAANRAMLLTGSGPAGWALTFYASSDLLNWLPIATVPNPTGVLQFTNSDPAIFQHRFYRARAE